MKSSESELKNAPKTHMSDAEELWEKFKEKIRSEAKKDDHGFLRLDQVVKDKILKKYGTKNKKKRVLDHAGFVECVKKKLEKDIKPEFAAIVFSNLGVASQNYLDAAQIVENLKLTNEKLQEIAKKVREDLKKILKNDAAMRDAFAANFEGTGASMGRMTSGKLQNRLVRSYPEMRVTEREVQRLLQIMDVNGDGKVSLSDFIDFLGQENEKGSNLDQVIVDLQVSVNQKQERDFDAQNYTIIEQNLNQGTYGAPIYLWKCTKENAVNRMRGIVDLVLDSSDTNSALVVSGYVCLRKNLNKGNVGKKQYLWVRHAADDEEEESDSIVDIKFTTGKEKDKTNKIHDCPKAGFYLVQGNFNRRNRGDDIFLWYKPLQSRPFSLFEATPYKKAASLNDQSKRLEVEANVRRLIRHYVPTKEVCSQGQNSQPVEFAALFNNHDSKGKGVIKLVQFTKLLKEVGLNLNKRDMKVLMHRFDTNTDKSVTRDEFLAFIALTENELDGVCQEIRKKISTKICQSVNGVRREWIKDLTKQFTELDKDNDGILSDEELCGMLHAHNIFLTELEITRLRKRFDQDGDGRLDLKNFLEFMLQGSQQLFRKQAVRVSEALQMFHQNILGQQRQKLKHTQDGVDSTTAWEDLLKRQKARRGNALGYLEVEDISLAVERLGCRLSQNENFQLVMRISPRQLNEEGKIQEDAFRQFAIEHQKTKTIGLLLAEIKQCWLPQLIDAYRSMDRARKRREAIDDDDIGHVDNDAIGIHEKDEESKWSTMLGGIDNTINTNTQGMVSPDDLREGIAEWVGFDIDKQEWLDREQQEAHQRISEPPPQWPTVSEWVSLAQYLGADNAKAFNIDARRFIEGLAKFISNDGAEEDEILIDEYLQDSEREKLDQFCNDLQERIIEEAESKKKGMRDYMIPFRMFDADASGSLDLEELRELLSGLEGFEDLNEDYVQELLLRIDPQRTMRMTVKELQDFAECEEWPPLSWTKEGKEYFRKLKKDQKAQHDDEEADEPEEGKDLPKDKDAITKNPAADRVVLALINAIRPQLHHDVDKALEELQEAFQVLDRNESGSLHPDRIIRALQRVHVVMRLSHRKVSDGLKYFLNEEKEVDYVKLVKAVSKGWLLESSKEDCGLTGRPKLDAKIARLQRDFRDLSLEKDVDANGEIKYSFHLKKVFRKMDKHRSGLITPEQFRHFLKQTKLGKDLKSKDILRIFYVFDQENHQKLDYREFMNFMLNGTLGRRHYQDVSDSDEEEDSDSDDPSSDSGSQSSHISLGSLPSNLSDFDLPTKEDRLFENLRSIFDAIEPKSSRRRVYRKYLAKYDKHDRGRIPEKRFRYFCEKTGFRKRMKSSEFTNLMSVLDHKDSGYIDYELFCKKVIDPDDEDESSTLSLSSLKVSDLIHRVQDAVMMSMKEGKTYHTLFGLTDPQQTGFVDKANFLHTMALLGCQLKDNEAQALLDRLTPRSDGKVDYEELWRLLIATRNSQGMMMDASMMHTTGMLTTNPSGNGLPGMNLGPPTPATVQSIFLTTPRPGMNFGIDQTSAEVICANVREIVLQKQKAFGPQFSLVKGFEAYDPNLQGFVAVADFSKVMQELGVLISPKELQTLLLQFKSGYANHAIDYLAFTKMVLPQSASYQEMGTSLAQVAAKLIEQARRGITARNVFLLHDVGGTGYVSAYNFRASCRELNLYFTEAVNEALIQYFADPRNPGMVNYEAFLAEAREKVPPTEMPDYSQTRSGSVNPRLLNNASDENLQTNNVEQWYVNQATPYQQKQFENIYESIKDFRESYKGGEKPMLPNMKLRLNLDKIEQDFSRPLRETSRSGTLQIRDLPSPISPRVRKMSFPSEAVSPIGSAGASIWGTHNRDNKGKVPNWAKKSNHWMCAVCFYTENPSSRLECEICQSTNPQSREVEVVQQCSNCTFQNEEYATECEMCGEKLHYGASSSKRKEQQQYIQGRRLLHRKQRNSSRFGDDDDGFFGGEAFPVSDRSKRYS